MNIKRLLKNKKGDAISLLILLPVLIISLFILIYNIDMIKCANEVEDVSRICISLAKNSTSYQEALQNVQNYCEKVGKFASVTENNLYVVSTKNDEEILMNVLTDGYNEETMWVNGALIELNLTKYSDYYGASAFKVCSFNSQNCTTIVSTAKTAKIRGYISIGG